MNGAHPDIETLADAAEGLLDPDLAARVGAHTADCATCADQLAAIEDVRTMLRELPDVPMPADVAQRLEAVLAEARDESSPATGQLRSATVLPMDARRRRSRGAIFTVIGSAAASVVVLVAVVVGLHGLGNDTKPTVSGANVPARGTGQEMPAVTYSGRDYTQANLATALPELLAPSAAMTAGRLSGATTFAAPSATASKAASSNTAADAQEPTGVSDQLAACINSLDPGAVPLAIDVATYDGKPATVVVLPAADPARVDMWVLDSPCRADTFLLYSQLPRP